MNVGAHFTAVDLLLHVHTQQISVNYSLFYSCVECLPSPRIELKGSSFKHAFPVRQVRVTHSIV